VIWLAVQFLGSAAMAAGGTLAIRRSQKLATALVAVMLALILLKTAVATVPAGEPRVFPWDWYPLVEGWWFLFPAMFIFGAGILLVWKSAWKRDALLVVAGVLLVFCGAYALLMDRSHHELTGTVNAKGVCHQTSGYSCSAASAVMLLDRHGIASTEKEMAELCCTRAGNSRVAGTTESGLMRGLRLKVGGRGTPRITVPAYDRIPTPCVVAIQLNPQLSHSILVASVEPDQVRVVDPLYGNGTIPRAQFERNWKKTAIHLEVQ
jgi:predicted double-glycine peptidase